MDAARAALRSGATPADLALDAAADAVLRELRLGGLDPARPAPESARVVQVRVMRRHRASART